MLIKEQESTILDFWILKSIITYCKSVFRDLKKVFLPLSLILLLPISILAVLTKFAA